LPQATNYKQSQAATSSERRAQAGLKCHPANVEVANGAKRDYN
jgi:hypothetical protein